MRWFQKLMGLVAGQPKAVSEVNGFEVSLEKKAGILIFRQSQEEFSLPDETEPASVPYYFEISVRPTGENSEYPAQEKPSVFRYTVGLSKITRGYQNGVNYIPHGSRWLRFRLVEEFEDGKNPFLMGKRMPPHHCVMLQADFLDASSGKKSEMGIGGWVRKSETETRDWKAALSSRVFYV